MDGEQAPPSLLDSNLPKGYLAYPLGRGSVPRQSGFALLSYTGEHCMADVFISYSRKDRPLALDLANDLKSRGYSVWWDKDVVAGRAFYHVIRREIDKARAAIVIWTAHSVEASWVRWEAKRALRQGKLVTVQTDDLEAHNIPPVFDELHTEMLSDRAEIFRALDEFVQQSSGQTPEELSFKAALAAETLDAMQRHCEVWRDGPTAPKAREWLDRSQRLDQAIEEDCHNAMLGAPDSAVAKMVKSLAADERAYWNDIAKKRTAIAADRYAFERAKKLGTPEAYQEYRHDYPNGTFKIEVNKQLEQFDWERAKNLHAAATYKEFEKNHPNSQNAPLARTLINQIDAGLIRALDVGDQTVLSASADGVLVVSAGPDGALTLWDVREGTRRRLRAPGHSAVVTAAAFSRDARTIVTGEIDTTGRRSNLNKWDVASGREVWTRYRQAARSNFDGRIETIAISNRNSFAISGGADGLKLWRLSNGWLVRTLAGYRSYHRWIDLDPHRPVYSVKTAAFSHDDGFAMAAFNGAIRKWRLGTIQNIVNQGSVAVPFSLVRERQLSLAGISVDAINFSPDGQRFMVASHRLRWNGVYQEHTDVAVTIWSMHGGHPFKKLRCNQDKCFTAVAFSPCGRYAVTGRNGELAMWDIDAESKIHSFDLAPDVIRFVNLSPDGESILCGAHREFHVWAVPAQIARRR